MTHRTAYATKTSTYLERVFLKNNYNVDATNRNPAPVTTVTIPYIKDTSETISRILQPYSIRVAHKPTTALQHLLINYYTNVGQGRTQQQTVYKIKCSYCQPSYIGETCRSLDMRLTEHTVREMVMPTITLLHIIY